ncbi:DUF302 domain-containing protein [Sulfitobacter sp.]|uniref:DUF302 domain-containing protein n=1 Tax=Sulfitobacter sp. TaxID=1903071 RepID=UPI003001E6A0
MRYTINHMSKDSTFDNIDARTRQALADHGFGVLTEVDVKLKMKLDVEMPAYRNIGTCNPKVAHQAIGIDPVAPMQAIKSSEFTAVAGKVRDIMAKSVEAI